LVKEKDLLIISIFPLSFILIWVIWSYLYVGLLIPVSGTILAENNRRNLDINQYLALVVESIFIFIDFLINLIHYTPGNVILQFFIVALYYGIPFLIVLYYFIFRKDNLFIEQLKTFNYLILSLLLFIGYYCFYQLVVRLWYALFPCFTMILFYSIILSYLIEKIKNNKDSFKKRTLLSKKNVKFLIIIIFAINFFYIYI